MFSFLSIGLIGSSKLARFGINFMSWCIEPMTERSCLSVPNWASVGLFLRLGYRCCWSICIWFGIRSGLSIWRICIVGGFFLLPLCRQSSLGCLCLLASRFLSYLKLFLSRFRLKCWGRVCVVGRCGMFLIWLGWQCSSCQTLPRWRTCSQGQCFRRWFLRGCPGFGSGFVVGRVFVLCYLLVAFAGCFVDLHFVGVLFVVFATLILRIGTLCYSVRFFCRGYIGLSWLGILVDALVWNVD